MSLTSEHRKNIPFLVIAIAAAFMAVDTFTQYHITEQTIQIIEFVLTPLGLGGLANKGFDILKVLKTKDAS